MFDNWIITLICVSVIAAIIGGILWQLWRTDTDIRPQDGYLSEREALRFRLDNDLRIK